LAVQHSVIASAFGPWRRPIIQDEPFEILNCLAEQILLLRPQQRLAPSRRRDDGNGRHAHTVPEMEVQSALACFVRPFRMKPEIA
jgi:hypothetical protein